MPEARVRRIALVVGDTAGHTYPALAVADAFRARDRRTEVVFAGTAGSVAAALLQREGHAIVAFPGSAIRFTGAIGFGIAMIRSARAIAAARRVFAARRTDLVIGFGGFASGGVLLAARSLGLRTAIHEANVEFGLANAMLRPFVHRVFRGLQPAGPATPAVGVPLRQDIARRGGDEPQPPDGALRILVSSGSRGSAFFRRVLPAALGRVARSGVRVDVVQQTDEAHALQSEYVSAGVGATVKPFIEHMPDAYAWSNAAISRAGANTIAELAVAGLPALLVPLADAAADHQTANARLWESAGAGLAVAEEHWNEDAVVSWLRTLADNSGAWLAASRAARGLARPDAAARLVDECEQMMQGRW